MNESVEQHKNEHQGLYGSIGALAGAGATVPIAAPRILGTKRIYHGTSKENWENIKNEGLRHDLGGRNGASMTEDSLEQSQNMTHLTAKRKIGNYHANFSDLPEEELSRMNRLARIGVKTPIFDKPKNGIGHVLSGNIPFEKWQQMEIDPIFNEELMGNKDNRLVNAVMRDNAVRGSIDVLPVELDGTDVQMAERLKYFGEKFPDYVKKFPGRFALGAGTLGAGVAGGYALGNKLTQERS